MKKIEANRYPHSAALFKFCKEALEIRYEGNVKVIDQDVGSILGYDPADCSHWKKGKKNIRALPTLRTIADHFNVDDRLLIDIAAGKIDLEEAVFEYRGYGAFAMLQRQSENLRKEFYKNPGRWQSEGHSFEELFDVNRPEVVRVVQTVLAAGNFIEAPIYLPELFLMYPNIQLVTDDSIQAPVVVDYQEIDGAVTGAIFKYRNSEMRPYVRFLLAKQLFIFFAKSRNVIAQKFFNSPDEVLDVQANIFASKLLIPGTLLRREVDKISSSHDIILQLADMFWVSKTLMNQRLRDYMENLD